MYNNAEMMPWYVKGNMVPLWVVWDFKNQIKKSDLLNDLLKSIVKINKNKSILNGLNKKMFEQHLSTVLAGLLNGYHQGKKGVAYHRDVKIWRERSRSRYNVLNLERTHFLAAIDTLTLTGLVDHRVGNSLQEVLSGVRMSEDLYELVKTYMIHGEDQIVANYEPVVLNRSRTATEPERKYVEYDDTDETIRMRNDLRRYAKLLNQSHITIHKNGRPYQWQYMYYSETKNKDGKLITTKKGPFKKILTLGHFRYPERKFKDSFSNGGRIYMHFQETIKKDDRSLIRIDGDETVEFDYTSLHMALIAAKHGIQLDRDFYEIYRDRDRCDDEFFKMRRKIIKLYILTMLNATDDYSAYLSTFQSIHSDYNLRKFYEEENKKYKDQWLWEIRDQIERIYGNTIFARYMNTGAWTHLQRSDSDIAMQIINKFTSQDEIIVPVHDSFICKVGRSDKLKEEMIAAFEMITKKKLSHAEINNLIK